MDKIRKGICTYTLKDAGELDSLCEGKRYIDNLEGSNLWVIGTAFIYGTEFIFYEDANGVLFDFCVTINAFGEF